MTTAHEGFPQRFALGLDRSCADAKPQAHVRTVFHALSSHAAKDVLEKIGDLQSAAPATILAANDDSARSSVALSRRMDLM